MNQQYQHYQFFYNNEDGSLVLNEENQYFEQYQKLAIRYLALDIEEKGKLIKTVFNKESAT